MRTKSQISVLPKPKRVLHQQYLPTHSAAAEPMPQRERGLFPGEPENCRRRLRPFLRNLVFLGLLLLVFKVFRIEERAYQGRAFQTLATLAFLAFPIHYLSPYRFKKAVFLAISLVGLFLVFGALLAGIVLAFAAVLIGVCFLPIRWSARCNRRRNRCSLHDRTAGTGKRGYSRLRLGDRRVDLHVPDDDLPL